MTGPGTISVVVPCFNLGRTVEEAVDSALVQTRDALEIVVVDDGSNDRLTLEVLETLDRPRTTVIRTANGGVAKARNHGVAKTCGNYLVLLDADDALDAHYLERLADVLDGDESAGFVSCPKQAFEGASYWWRPPSVTAVGTLTRGSVHVSSMFRRSLWTAVGGFDTELPAYEDLDFWLSALRRGFRGRIVDDTVLFYRVRSDSRYRQALSPDTYRQAMTRILDRHRGLVESHGLEILQEKEAFLAELVEYHDRLEAERRAARDTVAELDRRIATARRTAPEAPAQASTAAPRQTLDGRVRHRTSPRVLPSEAVILAYHRIASLTPDTHQLCVSAEHFHHQLAYLRQHCTVMRLADLLAAVAAGVVPPRAVAITFDDGYRDALATAAPLLANAKIPATFFVNTDGLDREHEGWHDEVEYALLGPHELPAVMELPTSTGMLRAEIKGEADRLVALRALHVVLYGASAAERARMLDALYAWAKIGRPVRPERRLMTGDEVRQLAQVDGCDIGSHSVSHLALPMHPTEVQSDELRRSRESLERLLSQPVTAFAYPFGEHDAGLATLVRDAGYHLAVTTSPGRVTAGVDPMLMPRVEVPAGPLDDFAALLDGMFTAPGPRRPRRAESSWTANDAMSQREIAAGAVRLDSRPQFVIIDPSSRCNARCVMCPVSFRAADDHGVDLADDIYQKLKGLLSSASHVNLFSSGEPTIARGIVTLVSDVRRSSDPRTQVCLSTNGKRLSEALVRELIAPATGLQFSVDGGTREVFELVRRGIRFDDLLASLTLAQRMRGELPFPTLTFSCTMSKRNIHDLANIFDLARRFGVNHVYFYEEDPEVPEEEPFLLDESDRPVFEAQLSRIESTGVPYSNGLYFRGQDGLRALEPPAPDDPPPLRCLAPWKVFHQKADGTVRTCCTLRKSMGNLTEQTFDDVWNGPEYVRLRKAFVEQSGIPGTCYRCTDPLRTWGA